MESDPATYLTCSVCNEWFSKPRTLPCLHSFCENCLSKHILSSVSKSGRSSAGYNKQKEFNCPECTKNISEAPFASLPPNQWVTVFPVNKFLLDLLDIEKLKRGDKSCGPCSRNGEQSAIASWCKECRDGLCVNCAKVHKGMRISLDHTVLDRADYVKQVDLLKEYQEPCTKHPGKTLDMFCILERELCCPNCVAEEHRRCDRVVTVAEAAAKCRTEREPGFLADSLDQYVKHIERTSSDRNGHMMKLEENKDNLMEEFSTVKKDIINLLDQMEKAMMKDLNQMHVDELKQINDEMKKCKAMKSAVTNALNVLKVTEKHGSDSRLMNTLELIRKECFWYEEDMGKLRSKIQDTDYDFELDPSIEALRRNTKTLGKLSLKHFPSKLPPFPNIVTFDKAENNKLLQSTLSLRGRGKLELVRTFEGKAVDDRVDSWHTGVEFLPDGRLVLVDRQNKKVKVYSKTYRIQQTYTLSSKPWDVTKVGENEISVSLPEEHGVQVLDLSDGDIQMSNYFATTQRCYGITFARGKYFTLSYDGSPAALLILSSGGEELAAITEDDDGNALFSRPIYITSNAAGSLLFISDERKGAITTLTETSTNYFSYSCLEVSHVAGLVLDPSGNLYVCRNHTKSVQVIGKDGDKLKTLVSRDQVSYPRAIAYDAKEDRLVVTQGDKTTVKVFQFVS